MKRFINLIATAAVIIALPACAAGNNGINTRNMTGNNIGPNAGNLTRQGYINRPNATYRDGSYTAFGDPHSSGNEQATVIILNGRIAGIALNNIGLQNTTNNRIGNGTATYHQGRTNNQTGDGMGMNKPGRTETGNDTLTGINSQGANNQSGSGRSNALGIGGGIVKGDAGDDALNEIRARLVAMMLQEQRGNVGYNINHEVGISNNDYPYLSNMVDNWKVAVQRALNKAVR